MIVQAIGRLVLIREATKDAGGGILAGRPESHSIPLGAQTTSAENARKRKACGWLTSGPSSVS